MHLQFQGSLFLPDLKAFYQAVYSCQQITVQAGLQSTADLPTKMFHHLLSWVQTSLQGLEALYICQQITAQTGLLPDGITMSNIFSLTVIENDLPDVTVQFHQ